MREATSPRCDRQQSPAGLREAISPSPAPKSCPQQASLNTAEHYQSMAPPLTSFLLSCTPTPRVSIKATTAAQGRLPCPGRSLKPFPASSVTSWAHEANIILRPISKARKHLCFPRHPRDVVASSLQPREAVPESQKGLGDPGTHPPSSRQEGPPTSQSCPGILPPWKLSISCKISQVGTVLEKSQHRSRPS